MRLGEDGGCASAGGWVASRFSACRRASKSPDAHSMRSICRTGLDAAPPATRWSPCAAGGCALADRAEYGVVNHRGQVYAGTVGLFTGTMFADGGFVPRALA